MSEAESSFERRRRCFALLRAVLDVPADGRERWLARHCDDAAMRHAVRALLDAEAPPILDRDAGEIAGDLAIGDEPEDIPAGARIGDWAVERCLGSGGMGSVYLAARQGDGFVQRGALKLIKRGMDSAAVLARFRRERYILSRLAHPNIAHLLDGGLAPGGQPYLVMEYVDGETLQDWCRRMRDQSQARIALFLELCDAVAHAHRQLVVHCDIKPGNVLVDADGRPHLLDFGIAKLVEDSVAGERTVTQIRFVSRAYAAPEQTEGGVVTTAVDVYQLGMLLSELLTDRRRDGDTPAVASASTGGKRLAANHASGLRGDAAVIVARATDADPARRYVSVDALAEDVRRWHGGHPILARPDSGSYRLRRFVGRHRLLVGMSVLALAAILAGAGLALWQAHEAAQQERVALDRARTAEQVKRFMVGLFQASDPAQARGAAPRADELLDRGAARIDGELAGQPRLQAELDETIAQSYIGLGRFDAGAERLEHAQRQAATVGDPALEARLATVLGSVYAELGRYAEALDALQHAERRRAADAGADPAAASRTESIRGWVLRDLGRYAESETALRHALALAQHTPDDMNPAALLALDNLAFTLQLAGRKQDSIATYERVLAWYAAHADVDDAARLWVESSFGKSLRDLGEPARARDLLERIRPTLLRVVGPAHSDLAGLDIALGQAEMDLGDAAGHARVVDAVARSHRAQPRRNMLWANAEFALADAEQRHGDAVVAAAHYASACGVYAALGGARHPLLRECERRRAQVARDARGAVVPPASTGDET